ncbi:hypothetical protein K435DRAFT_833745 [Dendrothele bispora CBS 962.96]|uniref:Uncharacterized protein n=1 Tax=Dendrothele bispora (strain CBS 962.96) TaxID=1314807 RepID=A0A4S8MWD7_DENBC|nr:hypothetical protein K435DRAFT_833745 [Dendrothele bispora CBS 962.96]
MPANAIALPNERLFYCEPLPPPPTSPPTIGDIYKAARFRDTVTVSHKKGDGVTVEAVVEAEKYYWRVMTSAQPPPQPDWLQELRSTIQTIQEESNRNIQLVKESNQKIQDDIQLIKQSQNDLKMAIQSQITDIKSSVADVQRKLIEIQTFLHGQSNQDRAATDPSVQVSFRDGTMP